MAKPTAQETALMTGVSVRGTSAAQHTGTMQTPREMDENACLAEQNLPCLPTALDAYADADLSGSSAVSSGWSSFFGLLETLGGESAALAKVGTSN
jgi:hypothetical protein